MIDRHAKYGTSSCAACKLYRRLHSNAFLASISLPQNNWLTIEKETTNRITMQSCNYNWRMKNWYQMCPKFTLFTLNWYSRHYNQWIKNSYQTSPKLNFKHRYEGEESMMCVPNHTKWWESDGHPYPWLRLQTLVRYQWNVKNDIRGQDTYLSEKELVNALYLFENVHKNNRNWKCWWERKWWITTLLKMDTILYTLNLCRNP